MASGCGPRRPPAALPEAGMDDLYVQKRPLMAVCDAAGSDTQFSSVGLISLRTGEQVSGGGGLMWCGDREGRAAVDEAGGGGIRAGRRLESWREDRS